MKQHGDGIQLAPTDLSNYLGCRHLSALDCQAIKSGFSRPVRFGPVIDELRARGRDHERSYLLQLGQQGLRVVRVAGENADGDRRDAGARTLEAMLDGADVIYQAALANPSWSGYADFLRRVEQPSALGPWSYEAWDTKLSRETRAGTILQLCVYSYLLEQLQEKRPERMHVVTPASGFTEVSYRVDDYGAYYRLLENGIAAFIQNPPETYPELVPHCNLCAWWQQCDARRRTDDHLCYVAGISKSHIKSLREMGVNRLGELANLGDIPKPVRGSREALVRVREQARVQAIARESSDPYFELQQPNDQNGLALLPAPTPHDIFLDFEGNHFADEGVREYLTGFLGPNGDGEQRYRAWWSHSLAEERRAYQRFIDYATETRRRNPAAHIYHFAAYEPTALKRLMGRYATRETELDELLRGKAFVDLYPIVRRAVIAGVESYSIKELERFCGYERQQDLREASLSRRVIEQALVAGDNNISLDTHRSAVERYNREDCESAQRLRDWLEKLRADAIANGYTLPRPALGDGSASVAVSELDQELQELRDHLLRAVPDDPAVRDAEQAARFSLAHMMEFHRREDKAVWWEYFRLLGLEPEEYEDERRALSGLVFHETLEGPGLPVHRYGFPPQEIDVRKGDQVFDSDETKIGTVRDVSFSNRSLDIKKTRKTASYHPENVVLHSHVRADVLRKSLVRLARSVLEHGFATQEPYKAALGLLLRQPPPFTGTDGSLQGKAESTVDAACRLVVRLDGHVLAIQGPPGTGKTYTGGHMICALREAGLKVGVTAVSHKVIENLLESAAQQANERGVPLRIAHKNKGEYSGSFGIERTDDYDDLLAGLRSGDIDVVGGTAWCWARKDFEQSVDVLIVDEAGQMAVANVLAVAAAARSLALLGDPQQLEQPLQSSHPEGSDVSALYHLLEGEATMPPDKGLFLAETYRLHPDIARFTSEVYYEGKVTSRPHLERQKIMPRDGCSLRIEGSGLHYVPVRHRNNQSRAPEEARLVADLVRDWLSNGAWRDSDNSIAPLSPDDILVVAPYNAQVAALTEAVPELAHRIGTVDRFQGQEAPVVVYSMTSSTPDDAPRGMDFLYDPHRFNVATSRARALCVLVGSPALFEPECRTPKQMRRANGFCRFLELAEVCKI